MLRAFYMGILLLQLNRETIPFSNLLPGLLMLL